MKKDLLVKLLHLIKEWDLRDEIKELSEKQNMKGFEILLKLNDEQIEKILKQMLSEKMIYALIYIYTNSERIPENIQMLLDEEIEKGNANIPEIIDMLKFNKLMLREDAYNFFEVALNTDINKIEDVVKASTCRKLLNREDTIEFVKKLSEAKESFQSNYAVSVITDKNVIKRENAMEYVDAVINAYNELQAHYISEIISNFDVLKRKDSLQIVKFLAGLKEDYQVENACKVINKMSKGINQSKTLEFAKKVTEAKEAVRASYASDLIINGNIFINQEAIKFVDLVINAKEAFQSYYASITATSKLLLLRKDALDIVKAISLAKGGAQAKASSIVARNFEVLAKEKVLEIVESIAYAETNQSIHASHIAKEKGILNREDASDVIKTIAHAKSELNALYANKVAKNELVQNHKNLSDVIKIIVNAEKEYQIECASSVAVLPRLLLREDYLNIVNAVANSLGEVQAYTAMYELQKENNPISLEKVLEITNNPSYPEIKKLKGLNLKYTLSLISTSLKENEDYITQNINTLLSDENIYKIVGMLSNSENEEIEKDTTIKVKIYK